MTIRPATHADTDRLVELGARFLAGTAYGQLVAFVPTQLRALIAHVLRLGVVFVAEVDGRLEGLLAIVALEHPMSGERYAEELAWWVEPAFRGSSIGPRLLRAGESWTRENGLAMLKMVAPADTDVGAFYARRGYVAIETSWVKRLA